MFSKNVNEVSGYLASRGVNRQTIKELGLGYCAGTSESDSVFSRLGIDREGLEDAGLYYNGWNRFSGRVTFPIYDVFGRIIGFSGRAFKCSDAAAKYVNSPNSDLFVKSKAILGLFSASEWIRRSRRLFLVEGGFDLAAMHSNGYKETIACCGAGISEYQALLIKTFGVVVNICFDSDDAGKEACGRATKIFNRLKVRFKIIGLGNSHDPCDALNNKDEKFLSQIKGENEQTSRNGT